MMAALNSCESEAIDQILETLDEAVGDGIVHEFARSRESLRPEIGAPRQDAPEALVEDPLGPARMHHAGVRDADQKVAERRRVQDARVVEDDECHGLCASVSEPVLLGLRRQFVEDRSPPHVVRMPVGDHILRSNAAMSSDPARGDLPVLEQTERPRDVQQVGRRLSTLRESARS